MATLKNQIQATQQRDINRQPMPRVDFFDVRQNGDSTGEGICFQHYWTKLCIFDVYVFAFLCFFIFVLSMYFVELSHASHS